MWGFMTLLGLGFAVGGLIWLYARYLGKGDVRAAFDHPPDRKKIFIIGGALIVVATIIFIVLLATKTISF